jgi:putative acetyltransferase
VLGIREESPGDEDAVRALNRAAFEGDAEARLVDLLRSDGEVVASLVAVEDGEVVGHILFSHVSIQTESGAAGAVSLAPMAVVPERQRRGIGSALVRRGLEVCRERGESIVVVLGHAGYYPRFGFSAELAESLQCPFGCGDSWMALELMPGALAGIRGVVRYTNAFDVVR